MLLVDDVLRHSDTTMAQVDGIAVAAGPGSFTGLRIGMACTKAIAQARQIPCLGVNTLDALCLQAQGAPVRLSLIHIYSPNTPSAVRLWAVWKALTACCVTPI